MWKILAAGFVVLATPLTAAAQSSPADAARIAALESRLAVLEARLAVDATTRNVTLGTDKDLILQARKLNVSVTDATALTSGKTILLNAGDDIVIQAGKSKLILRKSGAIELSGTEIVINGERSVTAKQGDNVLIKGSKIGAN